MSRNTSSIKLTEFQLQVVIGSLLGDSSLSKPSSGINWHLSCYHSAKQSEWLQLKHQWLLPASRPIQWCAYKDKRDGKTRHGGRFHTVSIPDFTILAGMLYKQGRKVIANDFLRGFTHPISLACLICDDGSWDGAGIAIASKQFSVEENERLAHQLRKSFGLSVSVMPNGQYCYVRITARSVGKALDICKPWVPSTLLYKFGPSDYRTRLVGKIDIICESCGKSFMAYESENRRACSPECGNTIKSCGYKTRHTQRNCSRCGLPFLVYNKRQTKCQKCRKFRIVPIPCAVCGGPVISEKNITCSRKCNVVLGHRSRH